MKKLLAAAGSLLFALNVSAADRNLPRNALSAFPAAVVPVMANTPGVIPGTFFKTKVAIINPTQLAYPIQVTLYDGTGQVGQATINMLPGQIRNYDNFLEQIFGRSGAGSVVFNSGAGVPGGSAANDFIVSAEVFTDSPSGKYKTVVTSGALLDAVSNLSEAYSLGITVDGNYPHQHWRFQRLRQYECDQCRCLQRSGNLAQHGDLDASCAKLGASRGSNECDERLYPVED